jgi:hypothetical protein
LVVVSFSGILKRKKRKHTETDRHNTQICQKKRACGATKGKLDTENEQKIETNKNKENAIRLYWLQSWEATGSFSQNRWMVVY